MTSFILYALIASGLPLVYILVLLIRRRHYQRRAAMARHPYSVFCIAARVGQEQRHASAHRPVRWPRADPDHDVSQGERPRQLFQEVRRAG